MDRAGAKHSLTVLGIRGGVVKECSTKPSPAGRSHRDAAVQHIRVVQELDVNSHVLHIQFKHTITEKNMMSLWPLCDSPLRCPGARRPAPCTHHAGHSVGSIAYPLDRPPPRLTRTRTA